MLYQILGLLAVHYIADFVLQTHWQAQNKSKDNSALLTHCFVYLICLVVAGPIVFPNAVSPAGAYWCVLNFAMHFATDWVTSRWTSKLWAQQRWHDFFVVVGLDQLIHYFTLLLTARWLSLL